jgi:hypothetical protein
VDCGSPGAEQPGKPELHGASGKVTKSRTDNTGVTGLYTSSEGLKGDVWVQGPVHARGNRIRGRHIAMLEHPSNPNSPPTGTRAARGLFANVLGQRSRPEQEELTMTLEPASP